MFLWESIAFGPIYSRRLGSSLGINILPVDEKICSFDCIYCECGWTLNKNISSSHFAPVEIILKAIEEKLRLCQKEDVQIDSITFAGNGEPTLHPGFGEIITGLISLRDRYYKKTNITCLSNSTQLYRPDVKKALQQIENPILKLDAGSEDLFQKINRPVIPVSLQEIISHLKTFNGQIIIQTLLFKGSIDGIFFDNSSGKEFVLLLDVLEEIAPRSVMLYSLDRETPAENLIKISTEELEKAAGQIRKKGIPVAVY